MLPTLTSPSAGPGRTPPLPRTCVAVSGATVDAMLASSASLLPAFHFQEFRLDYLAEPRSLFSRMAPQSLDQGIFLATCRRTSSGGHFRGSATEELAILAEALRSGFRLVDLALETAEELGPDSVRQLQTLGGHVVLSFHDFAHTPDLDAVLSRMQTSQPDLFKIVSTAENLNDSLSLLRFLDGHRASQPPIVAIAMGEPGVITRILGPCSGSAFTFASASDADATAPGQLTAATLTGLFRADQLSPATRLYGVAGDPIRSSLSPLMLNTAFQASHWDGVYLPLKTSSADELFRCAAAQPLQGFSVTMPLKQAVIPLLDELDPLAARIGAVNTVQRLPDGRFRGYNTDAAGIEVPLEARLPLRGARVLVLGAGGAARAAVFGCLERGAQVFINNRTHETAMQLAMESGATAIQRDRLPHENFDVLINATPAGMRGQELTLPLQEDELNADLVFDLVYNPLETPLLALARAQGRQVIPGVEMFVHQGARQFELWTGQQAPTTQMRNAVLQHLTTRS